MTDKAILGPDGSPLQQELPEHLREGLQAFNEWAAARAACGMPLPPGGYFILNKITVLMDAIVRMRLRLAVSLQMPFECVKTDVEHDPTTGRIIPKLDVTPPASWLEEWQGGREGSSEQLAEFAKEYIKGRIKEATEAFGSEIRNRLAALGQERPDLMPKVIEDLLDEEQPGS